MIAPRNLPRVMSIALWFGISFLIHFVWEHVQMPLYDLPKLSTWEGVRMCLFATATGDMLFMLVIYLALASVHRDLAWPARRSVYRHPATWLIPPLVGTLLAIAYELWAVYVEQRWAYAEAMPLLPVVRVGLLPMLQMIVIPLLTLGACARGVRRC